MLKQSCLKHQRIRTSNQPKFYLDQRAVSVSTQPESLGKEWGGVRILPTCVNGGQRRHREYEVVDQWMLSGYRTVGCTPRKV